MAYGLADQRKEEVGRQQIDAEDLLRTLNEFDRALDGHWSRWYPKAREWYAIHAGDQWEAEAKMELEAKGRNPVVMNRVDAMISAISGAEITNRQTVRYAPREVGDVVINELYTGAVEWARDQCDANDEESQAFRDTLICGLAPIETRMSYLEDIEGMIVIERCDPLEFALDPSARKSNYTDAHYLRRKRRIDKKEKRKQFPKLCAEGAYGGTTFGGGQHVRAAPGQAYTGNGQHGDAPLPPDQDEIIEYQWRETEPAVLVVNPANGEKIVLRQPDLQKLSQARLDPIQHLGGVEIMQYRYWRAFRSGDHCIKEPLPDDEFTYKFITGKLDRNTGLPYGAVRAMVDPQRWSNKFLAQIDFILAANAKGGVLVESDAVEDMREFEERWAQGDSIIEVTPGAVAKGKITNKPVPPYPQGIDRLFQISVAALPEVVGVNKEMLGIADQAQAGVLEYQRKQAAYGVLSIFFDSMRRYRKLGGRHTLKLVAKYMSDGRIIRITNPSTSQQQYVPLMKDPNALKFDVIVDEAAAGPNQKERVWQMLMGLGSVMQALQGLPPEMILAVMEYSPLPASLVEKLREMMTKAQNDPQQQAIQQMQTQLQMQGAQAAVQKTMGEAEEAVARAAKAKAEAAQIGGADPRLTQATAMLALEGQKADVAVKNATAGKIAAETQAIGARGQLDFIKTQADVGLRLRDQDDARTARKEDRESEAAMLRAPTGAKGGPKGQNSDQALLYVLSGVAQAMQQVGEAMSAPTELVRDPVSGKPIGTRKLLPSEARGDTPPAPLDPSTPRPPAPVDAPIEGIGV